MKAPTDLYEFAEQWGSFGILQFVYSFSDQATLLAVEIDPEICSPCPAWYRAKVYLENTLGADEVYPSNASDMLRVGAALTRFLEPVEELLATKYAAVGVVEDWGGSMELFNQALQLPHFNWTTASSKVKLENTNKRATEEHEMLSWAWTDPVLKQYLWLDILLYDHAVTIHNKQLKEHGLS